MGEIADYLLEMDEGCMCDGEYREEIIKERRRKRRERLTKLKWKIIINRICRKLKKWWEGESKIPSQPRMEDDELADWDRDSQP